MSATRTDADSPTDRRPDRIVRSNPSEHRFRAATVDEALAQVRAALGEDVEIVEANRIRRGGIGGFFATELGVEVVARGTANDERSDVFEPFDEARFAVPTRIAPPAPAPRAWTVDNGVERSVDRSAERAADSQLVADPSMPPARARQVWREATRPAAEPEAQLPGFERTVTTDDAAQPTTFAEHFLRELVQDAEQLRRAPDRNRMLPVRDSVAERAPERTPDRAADTDDAVAPIRRRTASMAAAAAGAAATAPMGHQEPLAGTPVPRPVDAPVATPEVEVAAPTLPGMPAPTPKRRAKRSGTGTTKSTAARRAEAEAAAAAQAAAEAASASPARTMIGDLIDQCVALTSNADAAVAPSKIAMAVTLPDGSVMKVSIERPRRAGRAVRDEAGA